MVEKFVKMWYNTFACERQIGICKGDIQHEESLLSGFASFNNSVRIITLVGAFITVTLVIESILAKIQQK